MLIISLDWSVQYFIGMTLLMKIKIIDREDTINNYDFSKETELYVNM